MNRLLNRLFLGYVLFSLPFALASASEPLSISGIYPHLAMFNESYLEGQVGETGVGAVVPWAGKLWVITYSAHKPAGSADKLYEIDENLIRHIRPESVGGTPANRFIHRESNQLIIGPYFIDAKGNVRAVSPVKMFGRLTATASHLTNPKQKVYFFTMEEGLYEVDVNTLETKVIFEDRNKKDIPDLLHGYHGKGAYTAQKHLVVANNGEQGAASPDYTGPSGCLAEWDGKKWDVIQRHPFCEVTGPGGLYGNPCDDDPLWATGWDTKSLLLMLRDKGAWQTFRLPKASHTYDAKHGWYTEWPRIREIGANRMLMTMHGMFWQFPKTFRSGSTGGIRPLSSYLKIIGDFCAWNGKLVMGCDDTSLFGNPLAGQPQSNLWFIKPDELKKQGPADAEGALWYKEDVKAGIPSDPFFFHSFQMRIVHLYHESGSNVDFIFETDSKGNNNWKEQKPLSVPSGQYTYYVFPPHLEAEWIRLKTNQDSKNTIVSFQFQGGGSRKKAGNDAMFKSLSSVSSQEESVRGMLYPLGDQDGTLAFAKISSASPEYFRINQKLQFESIQPATIAETFKSIQPVTQDFKIDVASVIITDHKGKRFRLPKTDPVYDSTPLTPIPRGIREIATERSLLNAHGTFYELPRPESGGVAKIRPICTHQKQIFDFCSWRGLLVLSGTALNAEPDKHYFCPADQKTGLWFGTIDDLWKFGKPYGTGGSWNKTAVKAGTPSDPYLMYGYDRKTVYLSHTSPGKIAFRMEVDISGDGDWFPYQTFDVDKDSVLTYTFPAGYSAHWVRVKTDSNTIATAMFVYE